jgi:hypothetical protein
MEEMYTMALDIHAVMVWGLLIVVVSNIALTLLPQPFEVYAKRIQMIVPIYASVLATLILTGAIMMAAKHLEFTLANNVMIIASVLFMMLEGMRFSRLKVAQFMEDERENAKQFALKVYGVYIVLIAVVILIA